MSLNIRTQTYRPRQVVFSKAKICAWSGIISRFPGGQGKMSAVMAGVALVFAVVLTQIFHGQVVEMQDGIEQLQAKNTAIAGENVRLLAARAQVASKTQVAALAGTKLHLFEPDRGQVRRM
jgi:hypothetical protein